MQIAKRLCQDHEKRMHELFSSILIQKCTVKSLTTGSSLTIPPANRYFTLRLKNIHLRSPTSSNTPSSPISSYSASSPWLFAVRFFTTRVGILTLISMHRWYAQYVLDLNIQIFPNSPSTYPPTTHLISRTRQPPSSDKKRMQQPTPHRQPTWPRLTSLSPFFPRTASAILRLQVHTHIYISSIPYLPPCSIDTCVHVHPGRSFRRARAHSSLAASWRAAAAATGVYARPAAAARRDVVSPAAGSRGGGGGASLSLSLSFPSSSSSPTRERASVSRAREWVCLSVSLHTRRERELPAIVRKERGLWEIYIHYMPLLVYIVLLVMGEGSGVEFGGRSGGWRIDGCRVVDFWVRRWWGFMSRIWWNDSRWLAVGLMMDCWKFREKRMVICLGLIVFWVGTLFALYSWNFWCVML